MRRCGCAATGRSWSTTTGAAPSAARAWWLLSYHGHPDVRVLDGGWSAYVDAGGPVETGEVADLEPGDFTARPARLPGAGRRRRRPGPRAGRAADARAARALPRRGASRSTRSPATSPGGVNVRPVDAT